MKKTFNGVVKRERVCVGSKSERDALVLKDKNGKLLVLRTPTSGMSAPQELEPYVDQRVTITGTKVAGRVLDVESIRLRR